jgi:hypothetical protein
MRSTSHSSAITEYLIKIATYVKIFLIIHT